MSFIKTFKDGIKYMEIWPEDPILGSVFTEGRVKYIMRLGKYLLPPFIMFLIVWNFIMGGGLKGVEFFYTLKSNWPVTLCCVLFLLVLPLQGYYWFGKRSSVKLNKKQKLYYEELCKKLQKEPAIDPVMMDFAVTVKEGLAKFGRDILKTL